ncbi:helix-turn-helix protein [Cereibacter changlensis]|nr:helix-turn-helix protein [Cereibacter changlensis]
MSWIDLGLIVVNRFLGPMIMARTAQMMLVDLPGREQRFYSGFIPRLSHGDSAILKAQHYLQTQEGKDTRVSVLAEHAGLEERTFLRRFQKATGLTATSYAQRLRVAKSQELLQFGKQPVESIAWQVGYSDPGAFRKVFHRIVGLTPGEYRQRFSA